METLIPLPPKEKKLRNSTKTNEKHASRIREALKNLREPDNYFICESARDLGRIAREITQYREFSVDCETSTLNPWAGVLYCVSIGVGDRFYLVNFSHPLLPQLSIQTFKDTLGTYFADPRIKKVGFNINFDFHFLENNGVPCHDIGFDSYTASWLLYDDLPPGDRRLKPLCERLLGIPGDTYADLFGDIVWVAMEPKLARYYAIKDAELHLRLYRFLEEGLKKEPRLHKLMYELETPVQNIFYETETRGIRVDVEYLRNNLGPKLQAQMNTLMSRMVEMGLPPDINLDSPNQLSKFLFDVLKLPRIKGNSTDQKVLEALMGQHPIAALIDEYRGLSKLKSSFVDAILSKVINGRVHPSSKVIGTETGRTNWYDPPLLTIPNDGESLIRQAFLADEGYIFVSKDLKGQELRITSHLAGEGYLRKVALGGDIYSETAAAFYGGKAEDYTKSGKGKEERGKGKIAVLALLYGASAGNMCRVFNCSFTRSKEFLDNFFDKFPELKRLQDNCVRFARKHGYIYTILGRRRTLEYKNAKEFYKRQKIKGLNDSEATRETEGFLAALDRNAMNSPVQGSAADQMKLGFLMAYRFCKENNLLTRPLFIVHDENIFMVKEEEWGDKLSKDLDDIIINAIPMSIPFETTTEVYGLKWGLTVK